MTKLMTALTAALLFSAPAFAADTMSNTSGDSMMQHGTMGTMAQDCTKMADGQGKTDCMAKNSSMKKDAMGHDMAKNDSMGSGAMGSDSMGHDTMSK